MAFANQVRQDPSGGAALAGMGSALQRSARSLERLQGEVALFEPLLALTRWLPPQASWPADVPEVLRVAVPIVQVGAVVVPPLTTAAADQTPGRRGVARVLAAAADLGPRGAELAGRLEAAEAALGRIRGRPLGGPLRRLEPLLDQAAEALPAARRGVQLLGAVGPAVGTEGPRSYLLLGQNSAEMRATGGFIGSAGTVTFEDGAVVGLDYTSSYALDAGVAAPPAPAPLARYLGLGGWYLRDANWWPDFPASAAQAEQAWNRAGRGPVDGVIAFDTAAVEALLGAVDGVEVAGLGRVSAGSFERAAAERLYSSGALASAESFHRAKAAFLGALGRALVERLLDLPPAKLLPLGSELLRLLREKHLLVAVKDRRFLQVARAEGWDGAIPDVSGDSLYVVDTTVSYGDTYGFVGSAANLSLDLRENSRQVHDLVLEYINRFPTGLPPWMPPAMVGGAMFDPGQARLRETPGLWGNWLRVYLPPNAQDIAVEGLIDPAPPEQQFGRVVVAGHIFLAPGQRRTVRIRYVTEMAGAGVADQYRFFLQKQAGLECRPATVEVAWPGGKKASYRGCPTEDRWIELQVANTADTRRGSD